MNSECVISKRKNSNNTHTQIKHNNEKIQKYGGDDDGVEDGKETRKYMKKKYKSAVNDVFHLMMECSNRFSQIECLLSSKNIFLCKMYIFLRIFRLRIETRKKTRTTNTVKNTYYTWRGRRECERAREKKI